MGRYPVLEKLLARPDHSITSMRLTDTGEMSVIGRDKQGDYVYFRESIVHPFNDSLNHANRQLTLNYTDIENEYPHVVECLQKKETLHEGEFDAVIPSKDHWYVPLVHRFIPHASKEELPREYPWKLNVGVVYDNKGNTLHAFLSHGAPTLAKSFNNTLYIFRREHVTRLEDVSSEDFGGGERDRQLLLELSSGKDIRDDLLPKEWELIDVYEAPHSPLILARHVRRSKHASYWWQNRQITQFEWSTAGQLNPQLWREKPLVVGSGVYSGYDKIGDDEGLKHIGVSPDGNHLVLVTEKEIIVDGKEITAPRGLPGPRIKAEQIAIDELESRKPREVCWASNSPVFIIRQDHNIPDRVVWNKKALPPKHATGRLCGIDVEGVCEFEDKPAILYHCERQVNRIWIESRHQAIDVPAGIGGITVCNGDLVGVDISGTRLWSFAGITNYEELHYQYIDGAGKDTKEQILVGKKDGSTEILSRNGKITIPGESCKGFIRSITNDVLMSKEKLCCIRENGTTMLYLDGEYLPLHHGIRRIEHRGCPQTPSGELARKSQFYVETAQYQTNQLSQSLAQMLRSEFPQSDTELLEAIVIQVPKELSSHLSKVTDKTWTGVVMRSIFDTGEDEKHRKTFLYWKIGMPDALNREAAYLEHLWQFPILRPITPQLLWYVSQEQLACLLTRDTARPGVKALEALPLYNQTRKAVFDDINEEPTLRQLCQNTAYRSLADRTYNLALVHGHTGQLTTNRVFTKPAHIPLRDEIANRLQTSDHPLLSYLDNLGSIPNHAQEYNRQHALLVVHGDPTAENCWQGPEASIHAMGDAGSAHVGSAAYDLSKLAPVDPTLYERLIIPIYLRATRKISQMLPERQITQSHDERQLIAMAHTWDAINDVKYAAFQHRRDSHKANRRLAHIQRFHKDLRI